ncbi:MAG TPA: hypothetical protein VIF62_00525 [Labilithrix sp.]
MNASIVSAAANAIVPGAVSSRRKKIALVLAGVADLVQLGWFPVFGEGAVSPADDVLDVVVALVLLVTLGFKWRLAAALAIELVPGATLLPTWTAVVASLPSYDPAEKTAS